MAQTFFTDRLKLVSYLDEKKDYINIYLLEINRCIGQIFYSEDKEIALFITPAHQKNGYAPEALEALLKNGVLSTDSYVRINIHGYANSQKLFDKLGFEIINTEGNYEFRKLPEKLQNKFKTNIQPSKEDNEDIER